MKLLNNKKGSAILWAVLMVVILTILLGSVLTAASAYFQYTSRTIRRQQAYFTARSAMNAILEEFSSEEQERETVTISGTTQTYVGDYEESNIPLMPSSTNEMIKVTDFGFDGENIGTASAEITLSSESSDEDDMVDVVVTSEYLDQTYVMKATLARQPIYFGGIATKTLILNNSNFELEANTDLYFYTARSQEKLNSDYSGKAKTFDTTVTTANNDKENNPVQLLNGSTLTINGNLITQGDAKIGANVKKVAGHNFTKTTEFKSTGLVRRIWNANQYIISNKTLNVSEENGEYSTSFIAGLKGLLEGNWTFTYCNNTRDTYRSEKTYTLPVWEKVFGVLPVLNIFKTEEKTVGPYFGNASALFTYGFQEFFKTVDSTVKTLFPNSEIDTFTSLSADNSVANLALKKSSDDALATQYIEILSLSNSINNTVAGLGSEEIKEFYNNTLGSFLTSYGFSVMDISYIEFNPVNRNSYGDHVTPLTYLLIEDGIITRIKYGQNPGASSKLFELGNNISKQFDNIVASWTNITKDCSCVVVYLGENSTLELGVGYDNELAKNIAISSDEPAFTEANQTYFYTIYGNPGSRVVLNGNGNTTAGNKVRLTLIGGIECDNLEINGDVSIIYTSTSGSQVAKQKVAEYWTVVNYSD